MARNDGIHGLRLLSEKLAIGARQYLLFFDKECETEGAPSRGGACRAGDILRTGIGNDSLNACGIQINSSDQDNLIDL